MNILVVGATSAIARETARCFAQEGASFLLAGRNREKLAEVAATLRTAGAQRVEQFVLDATHLDAHAALEAAAARFGPVDLLLVAHGELSDQERCQQDVAETLTQLSVNATSVIALLTRFANEFQRRGAGTIAVISSVAGDRGRQSNYVYGTAKAAVSTFLQGLRNRLAGTGVRVVTIKPGFVDTPMTAALRKNLLFASAESVGRSIHRSLRRRRDVIYVPWFWRWIMLAVRTIPEPVFKRMRL